MTDERDWGRKLFQKRIFLVLQNANLFEEGASNYITLNVCRNRVGNVQCFDCGNFAHSASEPLKKPMTRDGVNRLS